MLLVNLHFPFSITCRFFAPYRGRVCGNFVKPLAFLKGSDTEMVHLSVYSEFAKQTEALVPTPKLPLKVFISTLFACGIGFVYET